MKEKQYTLGDFVEVPLSSMIDPQSSSYDRFVGLEHYDSHEPVITRYSGKEILTSSVKEFKRGDILIARRNVYLERSGVAIFDGITSGDSIILRVKEDIDHNTGIPAELVKRILPFVLNSNSFWAYANRHADGMNSKRISKDKILDFEFNLPSIEYLSLLSDKLWAAYELKRSYQDIIKATDEMVKSQFIEMFGDQNTNDKCWSESLVKDEFKLSMGKTPARNNPECWDNGNHKWVSISDMSSYARYTGDTSEYITDYAIADSGIKPVPKGTIIMSFKLSIGRTAITSEDIYTNEAIMAFADFDEKKFNIDFLHFLIANKNWLLGAKQAVKGQTLNKESIGNDKIIIPPIEMQEQFASIYNQADKSKFELKKAIEAIDKVIKSLINENL